MKRLSFGLLSAAVLLSACESKDVLSGVTPESKVINVEVEGGVATLDTKVSYTPANSKATFSFAWHAGDEISMFVPSTTGNNNQKFTAATAAKSSTLSGTLATWSGGKTVYAIYPYNESGYTPDGTNLAVDMNTQTVDASSSNAHTNGIMVATADGATAASEGNYNIPNLTFKQAMAFLYLELTNIPGSEEIVEVGLMASENIFNTAGKISLTDASLSNENLTKANKVRATVTGHSGTTANLSFALLPVDLSGKDYTIYFTTKKGAERTTYKREITSDTNFERNKFTHSAAILDAQKDFTSSAGGGTLMLADFDGTFAPEGDTWVIEDVDATQAEFAGLKEVLKNLPETRRINLEFPYLKALPNEALNGDYDGSDNNQTLASITCPEVLTIGNDALKYNRSLTTVSIPKVTEIGDKAFYVCQALASISFPKATTIGNFAFRNCTSLTVSSTSFTEVTVIGSEAFFACKGLTSVSFPKVAKIGNSAFSSCESLISIEFLEATTIGSYAFKDCSGLTSVEFPKATTIGEDAFRSCIGLTEVTLPKATTVSGFSGCTGLTEVTLPKATTVTGFEGSSSLTTVNLPEATSIEGFNDCVKLKTVNAPKVTEIGPECFEGCIALASLSFPALTKIYNEAFSGCDALVTLSVSSNKDAVLSSLGSNIFKLTETTSQEGKITLNIGDANASKISGNTLTVGSRSYTFKKINISGGGDSETGGEGEDGTGEGL